MNAEKISETIKSTTKTDSDMMPHTVAAPRGLARETIKEETSTTIEVAAIIIANGLLSIETRWRLRSTGAHHIRLETTITAATATNLIIEEVTETALSTQEMVEITTENREETVEVGKDMLPLTETIINLVRATETTTVMTDMTEATSPEVDSVVEMISAEASAVAVLEAMTEEAASVAASEEAEEAVEMMMKYLRDTLSVKTRPSKLRPLINNTKAMITEVETTSSVLSKAGTTPSNPSPLTLELKAMITPLKHSTSKHPASLNPSPAITSPLTSELSLLLL